MLFLISALLLAATTAAAPSGVWAPTRNTAYFDTDAHAQSTFSSLTNAGVNRVYIDVANQGTFYFQSSNLASQCSTCVGSDVLGTALKNKPSGFEVYAWVGYSAIVSGGGQTNDWYNVVKSSLSGATNDGFTWLKPTSTGANLMTSIISDLGKYSNLDGVQLDDHFACPSCGTSDKDSMRTWANNIVKAVKGVNSKLALSLSPNPSISASHNYGVYWDDWANYYVLFDEYVPQMYALTASQVQSQVSAINSAIKNQGKLNAGLAIDHSTNTDCSTAKAILQKVPSLYNGHTWWNINGFLGLENNGCNVNNGGVAIYGSGSASKRDGIWRLSCPEGTVAGKTFGSWYCNDQE